MMLIKVNGVENQIPSDWSEVSYKQYKKMKSIISDKDMDIVLAYNIMSIFIDGDIDPDISELVDFSNKLQDFLSVKPDIKTFTMSFGELNLLDPDKYKMSDIIKLKGMDEGDLDGILGIIIKSENPNKSDLIDNMNMLDIFNCYYYYIYVLKNLIK